MDSSDASSIILQRIINICDVIIDGATSENHGIDVLSELRHNILLLSTAVCETEAENAKMRAMCHLKDEALQNLRQDIEIEREVYTLHIIQALMHYGFRRLRRVAWLVFSRLLKTCRRKCPN